jgi:hypothetical protein
MSTDTPAYGPTDHAAEPGIEHCVPCGHLIERNPAECVLGRKVPEDCLRCDRYEPGLNAQERTRCEVWTRVMGYHRPISHFNPGKRAEHAERKYFAEPCRVRIVEYYETEHPPL